MYGAVVDPGFTRERKLQRECANLLFFCRKLYENERSYSEDPTAPSWIRLQLFRIIHLVE